MKRLTNLYVHYRTLRENEVRAIIFDEITYFIKRIIIYIRMISRIWYMSYSLYVKNLTKLYILYYIFCKYDDLASFRLILSIFRNEFLSALLLISSTSLFSILDTFPKSSLSKSSHNSSIEFFKRTYTFLTFFWDISFVFIITKQVRVTRLYNKIDPGNYTCVLVTI